MCGATSHVRASSRERFVSHGHANSTAATIELTKLARMLIPKIARGSIGAAVHIRPLATQMSNAITRRAKLNHRRQEAGESSLALTKRRQAAALQKDNGRFVRWVEIARWDTMREPSTEFGLRYIDDSR